MSDSGVVQVGDGHLSESKTGMRPSEFAAFLFGAENIRVVPNREIDGMGAIVWPIRGVDTLWIARELEGQAREFAIGRVLSAFLVAGAKPEPDGLARTTPYVEEPVPSSASSSSRGKSSS
jgi:hypothetical protein